MTGMCGSGWQGGGAAATGWWLQVFGAVAATHGVAAGLRRRGKGQRDRAAVGSEWRGTGDGVCCGADGHVVQARRFQPCTSAAAVPGQFPSHCIPNSPPTAHFPPLTAATSLCVTNACPPVGPAGSSVLQITLHAAGVPPLNDDLVPILTGGCPELGNWDPALGVQLSLEPGGGVWGARLAARLAGGGVPAKLVLCRRGDRTPVVWEPGSDRSIGPAGGNKLVLCGMTWGEQGQGEAGEERGGSGGVGVRGVGCLEGAPAGRVACTSLGRWTRGFVKGLEEMGASRLTHPWELH